MKVLIVILCLAFIADSIAQEQEQNVTQSIAGNLLRRGGNIADQMKWIIQEKKRRIIEKFRNLDWRTIKNNKTFGSQEFQFSNEFNLNKIIPFLESSNMKRPVLQSESVPQVSPTKNDNYVAYYDPNLCNDFRNMLGNEVDAVNQYKELVRRKQEHEQRVKMQIDSSKDQDNLENLKKELDEIKNDKILTETNLKNAKLRLINIKKLKIPFNKCLN